MFANQSCPSAEIIEAEQPVSVLAYEFVSDKAGAGKFRGGVPFQRALPPQRGRGDAVRALRPQDASALRPLRRQPRPAVRELPEPADREPAAAVQGDDADEARRRVLPHPSRRRRLGRSAGARSRSRAEGRAQRVPVGRQGAGRLRRRHRHQDLDRRCGRHRAPARGHAPSAAAGPRCPRCSGTTRSFCGARRSRRAWPARPPTASASTSAARSPTSCCSASDGTIHTQEDLLQRRQLRARHRRGPGRGAPRARASAPAALDEIRHGTTVASNAILEHKGAKVGLDHHQGLPRRAGDPHAAHAPPLRHRLGEAAAAGGALSAPRGRRARRRQGPCRARARSGRCRGAGRCAAGREGGGDRRLPHQLVRQSGARADDQGHRAAQGPEPSRVHLLRGAARDQGVRAHLDHRHQRLRHADRRHLSRRHAQGPRRGRHPGAAAADAVERRPDHRHGRRRAADEHHRVRVPPAAWSARRRWRAS